MTSHRLKIVLPLSFLIALLIAFPAPAADDDFLPPAHKNHWAWKRSVPELPTVKDTAWVKNSIDRFILARLEGDSLHPSPPTTPERLLRRITFDLVGLPPTLEEVDAFAKDYSAKPQAAVEKAVDRLLASPHYGERWGRHWLDVARFAESNGYEFDEVRPDAWRYRDYVTRSFNTDKPYDRFILEQLAGDELFPDDSQALVATAFNLLGPDMTDASDQAQRRQNTLNDMTDTAALAFLGMTVACARCHDHKFEPIFQADYYRLQAFFTPAAFKKDVVIAAKDQRAAHDLQMKEYNALIKPTRDAIAGLEEPYRKQLHDARFSKLSEEAQAAHQTLPEKRSAAQQELVEKTNRTLAVSAQEIVKAMKEPEKVRHKELQEELKKFDRKKPAPLPATMGLQDASATAPKTFLLERGELSQKAEEVEPGFPMILSPQYKAVSARVESPSSSTTGRRSALARWIASKDHPLTARVMVNRLWQHHFGRGIVATANDFGVRGERPSHPELLDWLAHEFVQSGWSIKHMHRLMLTSATYQQRSEVRGQKSEVKADPENRLLWRMNRLRLEGEIVRDNLLFVSGRLNPKMGGPGVFPPIPPEALQGFKGWTTSPDPQDHVRRSVYIFARRNLRFPFLEAFDLPDSNLSCPKRERSTTAPQSLALLNSSDVIAAAKAMAERLQKEAKSNDERIHLAYRLTLGRPPSETELRASRDFLGQSPLSELCRALFNVNEFVYLD